MRRAVLTVSATVVGLVALLSFKTQAVSTATIPPTTSIVTPGTGSSGTSGAASGSRSGSRAGGGTAKSASSGSGQASGGSTSATVTGSAVDTPYGPIEVRITVANGTITAVAAVEYPNDPHSAQINAYALPTLYRETIAADSANIDHVSGATYTSDGYVSSLQSALNKAGL